MTNLICILGGLTDLEQEETTKGGGLIITW